MKRHLGITLSLTVAALLMSCGRSPAPKVGSSTTPAPPFDGGDDGPDLDLKSGMEKVGEGIDPMIDNAKDENEAEALRKAKALIGDFAAAYGMLDAIRRGASAEAFRRREAQLKAQAAEVAKLLQGKYDALARIFLMLSKTAIVYRLVREAPAPEGTTPVPAGTGTTADKGIYLYTTSLGELRKGTRLAGSAFRVFTEASGDCNKVLHRCKRKDKNEWAAPAGGCGGASAIGVLGNVCHKKDGELGRFPIGAFREKATKRILETSLLTEGQMPGPGAKLASLGIIGFSP